ncbi:MAG TPA: HAD family hydrolase [Anaerolineales bacterium]|nr:HAD family hydrolase [Anaerolineales bacterium]
MHPAVFLDRDGVIIENRASYVRDWSDVEIYPQALEALVRARPSPYKFVIVTNQSAVGRGILALEKAEELNRRLVATIEQAGGRIDGVFMCPHAPEANCECRKPKPGLIVQAAEKLCLDLDRSILIGDAFSDLLAGQLAGVKRTVLVLTGRGASQVNFPQPDNLSAFVTYNTLADALSDSIEPMQP